MDERLADASRGARSCESFRHRPAAGTVSQSARSCARATPVACPRCGSRESERVSEFGSTPCKAHYRCRPAREPFDYFKCI